MGKAAEKLKAFCFCLDGRQFIKRCTGTKSTLPCRTKNDQFSIRIFTGVGDGCRQFMQYFSG
jgi:hypothetical protein